MIASKSIFIIGVFLILMPIMGFPSGWENFFIMLAGVILSGIALVAFSRERKRRKRNTTSVHSETPIFVDNSHHYEDEGELKEDEEKEERV